MKNKRISKVFKIDDREFRLIPLPRAKKEHINISVEELIAFGKKCKAEMGSRIVTYLRNRQKQLPKKYHGFTLVFPKWRRGEVATLHWSEFGGYWMKNISASNFWITIKNYYLIRRVD